MEYGDAHPDPWPLLKLQAATRPVPLSFFSCPAEELARKLLGCVLIHEQTAGMIVEAEAYLGINDLAAHASRGLTDRTRALFGPAGHAYVYFIYGMHECLNVVGEKENSAGSALLRALEPLTGLNEMAVRRHWHGPVKGLTNGPGKLTQAMGISRSHYGQRLDKGSLTIRQWRVAPEFEIEATPRVGVSQCADWPLRFCWKGHPCVSRFLVSQRTKKAH